MRTITSLGSFAVKNDGSEDFKTYVLEPLNEIEKTDGYDPYVGNIGTYYGLNYDGSTICFRWSPNHVPILTVSEVKEFLTGEEKIEASKMMEDSRKTMDLFLNEVIEFAEWVGDNEYRYMSEHQWLDAEGETILSNQLYDKFKERVPAPVVEDNDMTVEEFYSGFNLDFMTPEERQTIYTATELYAKGKMRQTGAKHVNEKYMITLEYYNGEEWIFVNDWPTEDLCWATLGGDNFNYRTIDETGKVLTDHSKDDFELKADRRGER